MSIRRKLSSIFICLISLLLITCSSSTDSTEEDTGPTQEQLAQLENLQQKLMTYDEQLSELLTGLDTVIAMDSILELMTTDAAIDSAFKSEDAVMIYFSSGICGGILVNPLYDTTSPPAVINISEKHPLNSISTATPQSKKTLYMAPFYSDPTMHDYDVSMISVGNTALAKAGYDNFTVYQDGQCTVEGFTQMSDYGFIRINTHASIQPSLQNIQDVYLVTGNVPVSDRTTEMRFYSDIINGLVLPLVYLQEKLFLLTPAFIDKYNDFSNSESIVSLGFCCSYLGGWPEMFVDQSGAPVCLGFDWTVAMWRSAYWANEFLTNMCDTERETALTVSDWYTSIDHDYVDPNGHLVQILYRGDGSTTLWKSYAPEQVIANGYHPTASPDGLWLSYELSDNGIAKSPVDGSSVTPLVNYGYEPDWSRTNNDLLVMRYDNALYIVNASTGATSLLVSGDIDDDPCWSPLGNEIAVQGDEGMLVVSYPQGAKSSVACNDNIDGDCEGESPTWSADGTYIAFEDGLEIMKVSRNGGNATMVVGNLNDVAFPSWSPDGKYIAFTMDDESAVYGHIWVADARGSAYGLWQITRGQYLDMRPCWSPDSKTIYFDRTAVSAEPWEETPLGIWKVEVDLP